VKQRTKRKTIRGPEATNFQIKNCRSGPTDTISHHKPTWKKPEELNERGKTGGFCEETKKREKSRQAQDTRSLRQNSAKKKNTIGPEKTPQKGKWAKQKKGQSKKEKT